MKLDDVSYLPRFTPQTSAIVQAMIPFEIATVRIGRFRMFDEDNDVDVPPDGPVDISVFGITHGYHDIDLFIHHPNVDFLMYHPDVNNHDDPVDISQIQYINIVCDLESYAGHSRLPSLEHGWRKAYDCAMSKLRRPRATTHIEDYVMFK